MSDTAPSHGTSAATSRWLEPIERRLVRIEDVFGGLAVAALVACGTLICVDVALRYALNRPIPGGNEIVEYALVYITFLGASWAVPRGARTGRGPAGVVPAVFTAAIGAPHQLRAAV